MPNSCYSFYLLVTKDAKLHIFQTNLYVFYIMTRKTTKFPLLYIVSKIGKGNIKSLKYFQLPIML